MESYQSIHTYMEPGERSPLQKDFMFAGLIEASDLKLLEKIGQGEQWNLYEHIILHYVYIFCSTMIVFI